MSDLQVLIVVAVPLVGLWLAVIVEVLRRPDLGGRRRVGWLAALLLLSVPTLAVYLVVRPPRGARISGGVASTERAEALVRRAEARQRGELSDDEWLSALDPSGDPR